MADAMAACERPTADTEGFGPEEAIGCPLVANAKREQTETQSASDSSVANSASDSQPSAKTFSLRCPLMYCNKVYPNKELLDKHFEADHMNLLAHNNVKPKVKKRAKKKEPGVRVVQLKDRIDNTEDEVDF